MALKIRLARGGSKKRPYYRIVVAENTAPRDGRYVEKVGTYNPMLAKTDENRVRLFEERVKYWLEIGAKPTDRVLRFLEAAGLVAEKRVRNNPIKGRPGIKRQEREAAAEEARKEAEEAAKAESETQAPAQEAPDGDAPADDAAPEQAAS